MFIEYIAYQDKGNQLSYICKTRFIPETLPADVRNSTQTYLAAAHRFGMEPCLVIPDIFRNPETDVIVYCQTKKDSECISWVSGDIEPELGFKLEFYIFDTSLPHSYSRCPLIRSIIHVLTGLRLFISEPGAGGALGWMTEPVRQWLDTLVMDLNRVGIKITGYKVLDTPGKIRLSIAGCSVLDACHYLAVVRYILFRKQTAHIKISLTNSIDPRDWSTDRFAGCSVTFSTKYMRAIGHEVNENLMAIANNLDTTICDCPDKFDSIFGDNRCETLVNGGPWWAYTAGLNTHGSSVNIKHRVGSPGYLIDIRPSSMFNHYRYAAWLIDQARHYNKAPLIPYPNILAITYESTAEETANTAEKSVCDVTDTGLPDMENVIKYAESGDESGDESEDEIEGLTIISHHESEPANRIASMARIKRRHKNNSSVLTKISKWMPF